MTSLGRLATQGLECGSHVTGRGSDVSGNGNETRISNMIFLFFTNVYKKHLQRTEIKDTFQLSFTYVRALTTIALDTITLFKKQEPCGNGKKRKLKSTRPEGFGLTALETPT